MTKHRRRQGESGDPRKRSAADRKADRVRWQEQAGHAEIVDMGELPNSPGNVLYRVGPVAVIETRLLPGAPASVKARYQDRIIAAATGRCPRCGAISDVQEDAQEVGRNQLRHDDDCAVLTLGTEMQWFDPRGVSMDGSGLPPSWTQPTVRELDPALEAGYTSFRDQEEAIVRDMLDGLAQQGVPRSGKTLRIGTQLHQLLDNAFTVATTTKAYCPHVDPLHPAPNLMLDHYRHRIVCTACYVATWEPLPGDQEFRCDLCAELVDPDSMGQVLTHVSYLLASVALCPTCFTTVQEGASV